MKEYLQFAHEHLPYLLGGVPLTLAIWVIAISVGFVIGLGLAWSRVYGGRIPYSISTVYVEIFRGTPVVVQMLFIYLGLPSVGIVFSPFTAAAIAIALNTAAYQAEYFRGSIQSISPGQMSAAKAQGMTGAQAFRYIVLPQALRRVLPQWSNEAIIELKFTSVAYTIGVIEVTARAYKVGYHTYQFFDIFLLASVIYIVMTTIVSEVLWYVEKKVSVPGLGVDVGRPEG